MHVPGKPSVHLDFKNETNHKVQMSPATVHVINSQTKYAHVFLKVKLRNMNFVKWGHCTTKHHSLKNRATNPVTSQSVGLAPGCQQIPEESSR
jgi:hypothetical protein